MENNGGNVQHIISSPPMGQRYRLQTEPEPVPDVLMLPAIFGPACQTLHQRTWTPEEIKETIRLNPLTSPDVIPHVSGIPLLFNRDHRLFTSEVVTLRLRSVSPEISMPMERLFSQRDQGSYIYPEDRKQNLYGERHLLKETTSIKKFAGRQWLVPEILTHNYEELGNLTKNLVINPDHPADALWARMERGIRLSYLQQEWCDAFSTLQQRAAAPSDNPTPILAQMTIAGYKKSEAISTAGIASTGTSQISELSLAIVYARFLCENSPKNPMPLQIDDVSVDPDYIPSSSSTVEFRNNPV